MRAFNQPLEQPRGTTESPVRRVALLVPCYNEEAAIAQVVGQFHAALPDAVIYVYDNNSKDGTAAAARAAGAIVGVETRQGKGHVVCRMFADVEADDISVEPQRPVHVMYRDYEIGLRNMHAVRVTTSTSGGDVTVTGMANLAVKVADLDAACEYYRRFGAEVREE